MEEKIDKRAGVKSSMGILIFLSIIILFVLIYIIRFELKYGDLDKDNSILISEISATIDFSQTNQEILHSASGFLHNPNELDMPPRELVKQVKPKQTRLPIEVYAQPGFYDYITQELGIESNTILLSSGPIGDYFPGDNNNWDRYEEFLTKRINIIENKGYNFEYEIWNEPNGIPEYWPRSDKQFFETWKFGYNLIRKLVPNAKIIGPSLADFGIAPADYDADGDGKIEPYMEEFLGYAKNNNVVPDVLSWHELNIETEENPEGGAANIIPHVNKAREIISELDLNITEIYINEYGGIYLFKPLEQYDGAYAIQYFYALEKSRVNRALRGCWNEFELTNILHFRSNNACFDRMDNLINYNKKPRSVWYAYKYYAEMTGNFVDVKLGEGISAFATFDKKKNVAYILIGVINRTDSVKVTLKNLTNILGEDLKISVDYVPYSYTKEGHSEVLINNQEFSGNILELGKAGKGDFYFIKISK